MNYRYVTDSSLFSGQNPAEILKSLFEQYLPKNLQDMSTQTLVTMLVISLILGAAQCFFGYKLYKLWITFVGALTFAGIGAVIATANGMSQNAIIGVTIAAAVLGALLGFFLWRAGLFLLVLSSVFLVVTCVCLTQDMESLSIIIGLAAGLICAILAMVLVKPLLILYTAICGGFAIAGSLAVLLEIETVYFVPAAGAVIAAVGAVVQILTNRKNRKQQSETAGLVPPGGGFVDEMNRGAAVPEMPTDTAYVTETPVTKVYAEEEPVIAEPAAENTVMPEPAAEETAAEAVVPSVEETAVAAENVSCASCGAKYPVGTKFCMKCGQKLV